MNYFVETETTNGGGVAWYIRSDISYIQKQYFLEIENIFFEIILRKTKPILAKITFSKF